jgi:predicted phage terminase large subunit-like protein
MVANKQTIEPQPGPQTMFLSTPADIAFYGGAAGGGKSVALLIEPLRHYNNPYFGGVVFRRNTVQVRNEGGLWDESEKIYRLVNAHPRKANLEWKFPKGMRMKFAHLENESTVYDWQGSQIAYIGFDELTHFTAKQFWYMFSRNRSTSGVPGYIRATMNPDADSWVTRFIDWWIGADGYPIKERSGVIRWFIRINDEIVWGDSREELIERHGKEQLPKSFTFIASSIYDNKILMDRDPSYLSNLMALSRVERLRLLGGNWKVRPTAGEVFQRGWFPMVDAIPAGWIRVVRYWDRAATKPSAENPDPDWTAGAKIYFYPNRTCILADMRRLRDTPLKIEQFVLNTASQDGLECEVWIEQDPGSAGVADADNYVRLLSGYNVDVSRPAIDKVKRALPVSAQCEAGNVFLLRRPEWNEDFFLEAENFGEDATGHDDQVDALSGAFNVVNVAGLSLADVL